MSTRPSFASSSIGTKLLVGFTGIALAAFLIEHLAGNLLLLVGSESFNAYAHAMISRPWLIYPAEAGLLLLFVTHVYKTITNFLNNRAARPVGYVITRRAGYTSRKSLASTTMIVSGLFLLFFVPFHLVTFKFGHHYDVPGTGIRDLHRLVVEKFSHPGYVVFYVLAMTVVGFHLRHGVSSAFQSLGIGGTRSGRWIVMTGKVLAYAIAGGFALIPIALFFWSRP
jgi:succinate dehydrogenase / fumarate reductase cytochrome b subunit